MLQLKHKVGRNELCACESGLKAKHCHLDPAKTAICEAVVRETMLKLILQEKRKQGIPIEVVCPDCSKTPGIIENCEFCNHTGVVTEKQVSNRNYDELSKGDKK